MKFFKKSVVLVALLLAMLFALAGCRVNPASMHARNSFGESVWECDDPYFYWHENVAVREEIYSNDVNYKVPKDADEEEILRLYGKMEINGNIEYVVFYRQPMGWSSIDFSIHVFRTDACYIAGEYTYQKVENQPHDYEVTLTVKEAFDIDAYEQKGTYEQIELPFESMVIRVTCVKK